MRVEAAHVAWLAGGTSQRNQPPCPNTRAWPYAPCLVIYVAPVAAQHVRELAAASCDAVYKHSCVEGSWAAKGRRVSRSPGAAGVPKLPVEAARG